MKKLLLAISLAFTFLGLQAQKQVLNDVLSARTRGTGAIIKDNTVTGYFSFYQLDKKDRKTRNYQLNIYDQNLTPLSNKKFSSQEDLEAMEASYNGDLICIKFFDDKKDEFVFKTYDQNAQQVNSKAINGKKVFDQYAAFAASDSDGEAQSLTPVEGAGFIHFVVKLRGGGMSHTYNEITFIPNSKEGKGWSWTTSESSEDFEWGDALGSNGKVMMCLVNKRAKLMSKDIEDFILGIDIATGKKLFEYPLEDKKYAVSTLNGIAEPGGNFQLFGLYFDKDAKTSKASSLGLFGFTVDPAGKVLERKYESWEKDVSKFLKVSEKGKIEDVGHIFFHKFVKTADNKIFAIGEQYKTNAGASVALSLLSGRTTMTVNVEDIYVFEFTDKFDLKNVSVFDKSRSPYTFNGITNGSRMTGMVLKYMDAYDYSFTQMSKDKSKFSIGYVDYDKTKGDKGWYFGTINYSDNVFKKDKLRFDTKATWQYVYPGKPGYVMISEYFRKDKKLEFRMEKLNF
jgi:hypothetical protein